MFDSENKRDTMTCNAMKKKLYIIYIKMHAYKIIYILRLEFSSNRVKNYSKLNM